MRSLSLANGWWNSMPFLCLASEQQAHWRISGRAFLAFLYLSFHMALSLETGESFVRFNWPDFLLNSLRCFQCFRLSGVLLFNGDRFISLILAFGQFRRFIHADDGEYAKI